VFTVRGLEAEQAANSSILIIIVFMERPCQSIDCEGVDSLGAHRHDRPFAPYTRTFAHPSATIDGEQKESWSNAVWICS